MNEMKLLESLSVNVSLSFSGRQFFKNYCNATLFTQKITDKLNEKRPIYCFLWKKFQLNPNAAATLLFPTTKIDRKHFNDRKQFQKLINQYSQSRRSL